MTEIELIKIAANARNQAYAPYSSFHVGAALLCQSGEVLYGCNVENASIGMTICAERSAFCQAIVKGIRAFEMIAIVAEPAACPCGACRQFMAEFRPDLNILVAEASDLQNYRSFSLAELLPEQFSLKSKT